MQNMIFSKAICLKDRFVGEASVSNSFSSDVVDIKGKTLRGGGVAWSPRYGPPDEGRWSLYTWHTGHGGPCCSKEGAAVNRTPFPAWKSLRSGEGGPEQSWGVFFPTRPSSLGWSDSEGSPEGIRRSTGLPMWSPGRRAQRKHPWNSHRPQEPEDTSLRTPAPHSSTPSWGEARKEAEHQRILRHRQFYPRRLSRQPKNKWREDGEKWAPSYTVVGCKMVQLLWQLLRYPTRSYCGMWQFHS